jgi:hypothetical protein
VPVVAGLVTIMTLLALPVAHAAPPPTAPFYDRDGRLVGVPFVPSPTEPRLSERQAVARFLADRKVARWLERYPSGPITDASFERKTRRWSVHVWSGAAGEIARGTIDDRSGRVLEAWTGPQVAWKMARGGSGAFGGKVLNRTVVWLAFCAVFLLGLADLRRPLCLRNADLLALLSFSVSLAFFNRGEIFRSVPLAYPPLVYLLVRCAWIGFRRRGLPAWRPLWPVWALAAVAVFLAGFRVGLNVQAPRGVIDVGLAGVVGADRILDGQAPYGHMPVRAGRRPCGRADADGDIRDRIQTNGRCESAVERGDTYGPATYLAYVPATFAFGWSGRWDSLPAAHATSIAFDLLTLVGLVLVGLRFGGRVLAAVLAFAWTAYPFTAYALNANTNDTLMPAVLVWGFWLATSPSARGAAAGLAGWTKFAALLVAPLWATYRDGLRPRALARFAGGFALATIGAFSILVLEPDVAEAVRTFGERTLGFQLDRDSPFSPWGWGQYHARGIPDLGALQTLLQVGVIVLAGVAAALPRTKGPLELAALTAAVLLAFELALTHWFYLYLPWAFPFVILALLLPRREADAASP